MKLKYSEVGFRAFYHHFILVPLNDRLRKAAEYFPGVDKADYVLTYGYIDHTAGMTLEILAAAIWDEDGFLFGEPNLKVSSKIRIGFLMDEECYAIADEENLRLYEKYATCVDRLADYAVGEEVEDCRKMAFLDACRSPEYPDDVLVYLIQDEKTIEGCWVRIEGRAGRNLKGILLNEPDQDLGVHRGETIEFTVNLNSENRIVLIAKGRLGR